MTGIKPANKICVQSVGTSNNTQQAFIDILKKARTKLVIDVRSKPLSRWFPHFNQKALTALLATNRISYLWLGKELGGFQPGYSEFIDYVKADPEGRFTAGMSELLKVAKEANGPVALMCSERDVNKCHRKTIIEQLKQKINELEVYYL